MCSAAWQSRIPFCPVYCQSAFQSRNYNLNSNWNTYSAHSAAPRHFTTCVWFHLTAEYCDFYLLLINISDFDFVIPLLFARCAGSPRLVDWIWQSDSLMGFGRFHRCFQFLDLCRPSGNPCRTGCQLSRCWSRRKLWAVELASCGCDRHFVVLRDLLTFRWRCRCFCEAFGARWFAQLLL